MSTKEIAYSLIDKLTDKQIEGVIDFIYGMSEDPVSDDEIIRKLEEAEEDIRAGRTYSFDEFREHIRRRRNELHS